MSDEVNQRIAPTTMIEGGLLANPGGSFGRAANQHGSGRDRLRWYDTLDI
jgi:hypothetical protein